MLFSASVESIRRLAMILSLSIRDFVLIDRLDIEPGQGFTALTGETGA